MNNSHLQLGLRWFSFASVCLFLVVAALPTAIFGQKNRNAYTRRDVNVFIRNLEQSSDVFRRDFDRYLAQSTSRDTRQLDRLNAILADYERSLDDLRRDFDDQDRWADSRSSVRQVINSAAAVNDMLNSQPSARRLEGQWANVRRDLNKLAEVYDLSSLNNGGGGGGNVPSWAIGTFTARNPQTGGLITLTIKPNGNVVADFQDAVSYGSFDNDQIIINNDVARVRRTNNGIRTTRVDNGESIDYVRGNNGGGIGNRNVPNWAIGTFTARNPQTGGIITLTINANGDVTVDFDGQITYGSFETDQIIINNDVARVQRTNNGIRTIRTDNGERINYVRRN